MSVCFSNFFDLEARFYKLLGQETLSYSGELNPLVSSYFKTMEQASTVSSEEAGRVARSVFNVAQAVFFKFQSSLSQHDQEGFLLFLTSILPLTPNLPGNVSVGIEDTVVKVCELAVRFLEVRPIAEDLDPSELIGLLRSSVNSLQLVNIRTAPLIQTINLFKRSSTLFVRTIPTCDRQNFEYILDRLKESVQGICQIRGGSRCVISHMKELFTGPVGGEVSGSSSYDVVQRLFRTVLAYVGGVFASCPYMTPDEVESTHAILDSLDTILFAFLRQCRVADQRRDLLGLRKNLHEGLCGLHPTLMIERYERRCVLIDPSFAFSPLDILKRTCVGLHSLRADVVPHEHYIAQYARTLGFAVRHCDEFIKSEFEKIVIVLGQTRKKWSSILNPIDQLSPACVELSAEIHRIPSVSFGGFNNIILLIVGEIAGIKCDKTYVDRTVAEAFRQVVDAIDRLIPRCTVLASQKRELFELRTAIVRGVSDIRPTFALDWFVSRTQPIPDASLTPAKILEISLNALQRMDPKTVDEAYAWDQITQCLAFMVHRLPEMTEEEFSLCKDAFIASHAEWANNTTVVSGIVNEWANQLMSTYRSLASPPTRLAAQDPESCGDQVEEAVVEDRGMVSKSKSYMSPTNIRRVIDALTVDLLAIEGQGEAVFSDMSGTLNSLITVSQELVSFFSKKARGEQRAQLMASHEEFLWAIGQISPRHLIDRLADIEPGHAPVDAVRRMEKMLVKCDRISSAMDLQMRLFLLELFAADMERYCRSLGMRLMPHPEIDGPTLCPHQEKSPLHLLLEESMVVDDLDVACSANCKEYAEDPEKQMWVLFTLRWYLRRFIEKQRRMYWRTYRDLGSVFSSQARGDTSSGAPSRSMSGIMDPDVIYSPSLMGQYNDLCIGRPSDSDPDVIIGETIAYFKALFIRTGKQAQRLQSTFQNLWPCYERGVEVLERHISSMAGYCPIARLNKKGSIQNGFPLLTCQETRSCGEGVQDRFFKPWIREMLAGGEVGFAKALANTLAPRNLLFENRFLRELRLVGEEEEEEPLPPLPALISPSVAVESPKNSTPGPKDPTTTKSLSHKRSRRRGHSSSPVAAVALEVSFPVVPAPVRIDRSPLRLQDEPAPSDDQTGLEEAFQKFSLDEPKRDGAAAQPLPPLPKEPRPLLSPDERIRSITVLDVERCMQQRLGKIAGRVQKWKSEYFVVPSIDQYDRHTYPFRLIGLIREYGEMEPWASSTYGRMNEHYVCIGMMERYGRRLPPLFGVFSEAFSTSAEKELYHHDLLERTQQELRDRYQEYRTFFDFDVRSTPKASTPFQKGLYEKLLRTGSFFSSVEAVPSQECCRGRFSIQIADMTLRVDDRLFGNAYTLALKLSPK